MRARACRKENVPIPMLGLLLAGCYLLVTPVHLSLSPKLSVGVVNNRAKLMARGCLVRRRVGSLAGPAPAVDAQSVIRMISESIEGRDEHIAVLTEQLEAKDKTIQAILAQKNETIQAITLQFQARIDMLTKQLLQLNATYDQDIIARAVDFESQLAAKDDQIALLTAQLQEINHARHEDIIASLSPQIVQQVQASLAIAHNEARQNRISASLNKSMATNDIEGIRSALGEAEAAGLDPRVTVVAKDFILEHELRHDVERAYQSLIDDCCPDVYEVEEAIHRAENSHVADKIRQELEKARSALTDWEEEQEWRRRREEEEADAASYDDDDYE